MSTTKDEVTKLLSQVSATHSASFTPFHNIITILTSELCKLRSDVDRLSHRQDSLSARSCSHFPVRMETNVENHLSMRPLSSKPSQSPAPTTDPVNNMDIQLSNSLVAFASREEQIHRASISICRASPTQTGRHEQQQGKVQLQGSPKESALMFPTKVDSCTKSLSRKRLRRRPKKALICLPVTYSDEENTSKTRGEGRLNYRNGRSGMHLETFGQVNGPHSREIDKDWRSEAAGGSPKLRGFCSAAMAAKAAEEIQTAQFIKTTPKFKNSGGNLAPHATPKDYWKLTFDETETQPPEPEP